MKGELVCVCAGLGIEAGQVFPVLGENGSVWEILVIFRRRLHQTTRFEGCCAASS